MPNLLQGNQCRLLFRGIMQISCFKKILPKDTKFQNHFDKFLK